MPSASNAVAVRLTVPPTTTEAVAGEICTDATEAETTDSVTAVERPLLDAVIVAEPALTPVTKPLDETCATLVFPDDQVIA